MWESVFENYKRAPPISWARCRKVLLHFIFPCGCLKMTLPFSRGAKCTVPNTIMGNCFFDTSYQPQLPSMWASVSDDYEVTPPQLTSTVLSVLETSGPPPKVLMVSEADQLPPPLQVLQFLLLIKICIYTSRYQISLQHPLIQRVMIVSMKIPQCHQRSLVKDQSLVKGP